MLRNRFINELCEAEILLQQGATIAAIRKSIGDSRNTMVHTIDYISQMGKLCRCT